MSKSHNFDSSQCPDSVTKITEHIQERADSGYEIPPGWLFKGLTFLFNHKPPNDSASGPQTSETGNDIEPPAQSQLHRLRASASIAKFAGAAVVDSLQDTAITHVIMDPDTPSAEISEFRGSLSARGGKKVPHIVTTKWVEESWDARTLLDEESKSQIPQSSLPFPSNLLHQWLFCWYCVMLSSVS